MTRLRGLVALVALAVVIGAVPWAVVRFGNWPMNGIPNGEQLRDFGDARHAGDLPRSAQYQWVGKEEPLVWLAMLWLAPYSQRNAETAHGSTFYQRAT